MRTPREWWIEFGGDPAKDQKENYKRYVSGTQFKPLSPAEEVVHVIEVTPEIELLMKTAKLSGSQMNEMTMNLKAIALGLEYLAKASDET